MRPAILSLLLAFVVTVALTAAADETSRDSFGANAFVSRTIDTTSGRADIDGLRLEWTRALSSRTRLGIEVSPWTRIKQPTVLDGEEIETVHGASAALLVRTFFGPGRRAYFEFSAGMLKSSGEVPAGTTDLNFVLNTGVGFTLLERSDWSLLAGYRWMHISNGNRADPNPDLDQSALAMSVLWHRPRRSGAGQ